MKIEMLQIPVTPEERISLREVAKEDGCDTTKEWVRRCIGYWLISSRPEEFGHLLPKEAEKCPPK